MLYPRLISLPLFVESRQCAISSDFKINTNGKLIKRCYNNRAESSQNKQWQYSNSSKEK